MRLKLLVCAVALVFAAPLRSQEAAADARLARLKKEVGEEIDRRAPFTQQMVDQIFSFGELGFQEYETSKYVVGLLRQNGFTVEENYAGIPTAWLATWGAGKPVIALGADIDDIPQASQRPGVACHEALVPGAPGHGEGHNAGQAVNITALLAVKKIMERDHIPGTLKVWPGVAEEQLGTKAYFASGTRSNVCGLKRSPIEIASSVSYDGPPPSMCAYSTIFSDRSMPVTSAPSSAIRREKYPAPQPTSSSFLPRTSPTSARCAGPKYA